MTHSLKPHFHIRFLNPPSALEKHMRVLTVSKVPLGESKTEDEGKHSRPVRLRMWGCAAVVRWGWGVP